MDSVGQNLSEIKSLRLFYTVCNIILATCVFQQKTCKICRICQNFKP